MHFILIPVQCRPVAFREADTVLVIGARVDYMLMICARRALRRQVHQRQHRRQGDWPPPRRRVGISGNAKLALSQLTAAAAGMFRPKGETP